MAILTHYTIDGIHVLELIKYGEIKTPVIKQAPIVVKDNTTPPVSPEPQKIDKKTDGAEGAIEGAKA